MVPQNPSVVVQNMFRITPKTLNAIYVVLGSLIDKFLRVIYHQMLTKALQRLIASVLGSSGIRIVNRALAGMVLNMGHEGPRRDRLHDLGIEDPAIALQQAKNDAFASRTTASLPSLRPQSRTHPSQSHPRAWRLPVLPYERVPASAADTPG